MVNSEIEYFIGLGLPRQESDLLAKIRRELEGRAVLSSPPHVTIKPPFVYHFARALDQQLASFAKDQQGFEVRFEKVASFAHRKYGTVYLAPEKGEDLRKLEQDLSKRIKYLPEQSQFIPHLTVANRIDLDRLEEVKKQVRSLGLKLKLKVNNLTLYEHERFGAWRVKKVYEWG